MRNKILRAFFETSEIDRAIASGTVRLEDGVPVFNNLVNEYLLADIQIADKPAYDALMESVNKINMVRGEHKKKITSEFRSDDEIDTRNRDLFLLSEDHRALHEIMKKIQELFDRKQWFIADKDVM